MGKSRVMGGEVRFLLQRISEIVKERANPQYFAIFGNDLVDWDITDVTGNASLVVKASGKNVVIKQGS